MTQLPVQSLAALPLNHDVRHLIRQILILAVEAVDRNRTPLLMSQKIVQLLYKTPSQLGREVFVGLLDQLCHSFDDVGKEAVTWLLYAEDEVSIELSSILLLADRSFYQRKFNVPVTVTLLRSGLIDTSLQDQQLAKILFLDPRPSLLNFTTSLIRECLSGDPPVASQSQFAYSIEVLGQLMQGGRINTEE